MKETYVVSFEKNTVTQARLVKAESAEQAKAYFAEIEPAATVYGVTVDNVGYARRGMPCEDVPDGWAEQPAEEAQEEKEIVSRPVWNDSIRGKRAEVWYRRSVSAYDMAARISPAVTADSRDAAAKLLDSVQRYAMADAREWEAENSSERYCNSAAHRYQEQLLDKRRERLQKQLAAYRVKMVNYGLYPSLLDVETNETLHFLHYFY